MKYVTVKLTPLEADGLETLAGEGKEALLTDTEAAQAYIGNKAAQAAAERAWVKLVAAIAQAKPEGGAA